MPLPIPRDRTLPLIGRLFGMRRDALGTLREIYRRHGPVVWTHGVGVHVLALFSADGVELVLRNRDGAFSSRLGWAHYVDHVFPGSVMAKDGADHRYHRRIMQEAFVPDALRDYVERMNPTIAEAIARWGEARRPLRAYSAFKKLTLDVATSTFMGVPPSADADRVNAAFIDMVVASLAVARFDVWPLAFAKGLAGRRFLAERFARLVRDKRRAPGSDLLSRLCTARDEQGERFSDREVVDHIAFVMMAAHDTSTSTLTSLSYLLAKHTGWQQRLREQSLAAGADLLDYDALQALEPLRWAIDETLRLYPPLPFTPRITLRSVPFGDYELPAGVTVGVAPILTHRLPQYWSRPDDFDPERFSPGRAEHKRHRYAFTPFGGGAHMCIGRHFGTLEIASTMHQLLRRYRWSVPSGYTMPYQAMPIARPRDGLPLRFERL